MGMQTAFTLTDGDRRLADLVAAIHRHDSKTEIGLIPLRFIFWPIFKAAVKGQLFVDDQCRDLRTNSDRDCR